MSATVRARHLSDWLSSLSLLAETQLLTPAARELVEVMAADMEMDRREAQQHADKIPTARDLAELSLFLLDDLMARVQAAVEIKRAEGNADERRHALEWLARERGAERNHARLDEWLDARADNDTGAEDGAEGDAA